MAWTLLESRFFQVKPQAGLAHFGVGSMTAETVTGQNRLHILVEIEMLRNLGCALARLLIMAAGNERQ